MSIILIGGIDRLEPHYEHEAKKAGMNLKMFSTLKQGFSEKLKSVDAVIIFTNMVSHNARNSAVEAAKQNGIPVFMQHACGVCTLRQCLKCIGLLNSNNHTA